MLIDAHAHLADPAFATDLGDVLARAAAAGVGRVVAVGETADDARAVLRLAGEQPAIAPAIGLYPTHLDEAALEETLGLIDAHRDRLVAVGEIGLDHWVVKEPDALIVQRDFFVRQVRRAIELDLPVNVHSRSAGAATIEALLECGARRVLLHAFDGRAGTADAAVRAGWFFSVPPSIVRSRQKQKLVRWLPLDVLLLESDAPVLGPEPGVRNEPANVRVSLEAIAEIKGVPVEEVAAHTTENARRLFGAAIVT